MTGRGPGRWATGFADARALAWPILTYWGTLGVAMALFCAVVLVFEGVTADTTYVLTAMATATIGGIAFGQGCAVLRIRTWLVVGAGGAVYAALFGAAMYVTTITAMPLLVGAVALVWFLFPFFAVSGLLSLRTSMLQVFALFAPLVWFTASILYVAENVTGGAGRWFAGDKWAVWDVLTAPILLVAIGLSVAYLAGRERHRVHRWSTAAVAPEGASIRRIRGSAIGASASGCGTLASVGVLVLVATVATGLLAPSLGQSDPDDDGHRRESPADPRPGERDTDGDGVPDRQERRDHTDPDEADTDHDGLGDGAEKLKGSDPRDPDTDGDGLRDGDEGPNGTSPTDADTDHDGVADPDDPQTVRPPLPTEPLEQAARHVGLSLLFLLLLVLLSLVVILVFGPPFRRSAVLGWLRRPWLPHPPTDRVAHAWRLCEVALGDLGVEQLPGDTARTLVARALPRLPAGIDTQALVECAEIADRVKYGLGIDPVDEMRARRGAEMAYQGVWEALGEWDKVRAVYRWNL
ncbi:MAG: hypothetical protein ABMB14_04250 [Myxococcota bacterium]